MTKKENEKRAESASIILEKMLEQLTSRPAYIGIMRDWFAAQAISRLTIYDANGKTNMQKTAKYVYDLADAMLKERSKRMNPGKPIRHDGKR